MTPGSPATASATVTARAPGKVILLGEHAVNRGQPAVAAAVALFTRCRAGPSPDGSFHFSSGAVRQVAGREDVRRLWEEVNAHRAAERHDEIRAIKSADFFAPQKYVLGAVFEGREVVPLSLEWQSDIPTGSGLGSGGAAFVSMVAAVAGVPGLSASPHAEPWLAYLGDVVAHGGIASQLDTMTSYVGGVIRFEQGKAPAQSLGPADGLTLVVGHTGVGAATAEVNGRVRRWLEESPVARIHAFRAVGALARAAVPAVRRGDWDELGRLMNLNQLVLEKIGVSCPEADALIHAALEAGALGAKVSGSGGGGIVVALAAAETRESVARAIVAAGGRALTPDIARAGARVEP